MLDRTPAIGCMRLSTDEGRDDARAERVLHAALDAGVRLLDTADVYCLGEGDEGHNERLIAGALARWPGPREAVRVATKGGLRRRGAAWVSDGRARHLDAACAASARALGVEILDLYQLHAPDPSVPLATSVRALAALRRAGRVRDVGLCNVTVAQIKEARAIVEIASVQVRLSLAAPETLLGGVVEYCARHGILLLAHTPLGGPRGTARLARSEALAEVAKRRSPSSLSSLSSPARVALAALRDLAAVVTPLPGVTRVETARDAGADGDLVFDDADRATLDAAFPPLGAARRALADASSSGSGTGGGGSDGEVVILMGLPGAGKSSEARRFLDAGYARLNRDLTGGRLAGLLPRLDRGLAGGQRRFVLDNTYASRATRRAVVEVARRHDVPVRCVWLETSIADAQINAVQRMLASHGRLLEPQEMRRLQKSDPNSFPPGAQFRYQRELEPPVADEGFATLEVVPFRRAPRPDRTGGAVILELDGVLRCSKSGARTPRSPDDVAVHPGRAERLAAWRAEGLVLAATAWIPEIEGGTLTRDEADACLRRTVELLGVELDIRVCPHVAGPPLCWCRKPLPGLGLLLVEAHHLDPARCLHVGHGPADRTFATRLGFRYATDEETFSG